MSKGAPNSVARTSSLVMIILFITLALSLTSLALAVFLNFTYGQELIAGYLTLAGSLGLGLSLYILYQMRRRRALRLKLRNPKITTTIECKKCNFKSMRDFQRGDFIFKELEQCQKCNENMLITAIYTEIEEKKVRKIF
jgi:hypothetical protein